MRKIYLTFLFVLFVTVPVLAQQTFEDFFKLGNAQYQQKNYDEAIRFYSECVRLNAQIISCYQNRGLALLAKSKLEPVDYVKVIDQYDGVNVKNATRLKALADVNQVLQLNPKLPQGFLLRALIYNAEEIYDKAVSDFRQVVALDTSNSPASTAAKAELVKAEKQYASSLGTKGRDAVIRASYLEQAKDTVGAEKVRQQAIEFFTKSLELDKTSYINWASRGDVYKYNKNFEAAISDYSEALKVKPDYADAYVRRADIYAEQKKFPLALADYERVIAMPVNSDTKYRISDALLGRGRIRLESSQMDAAIADFDRILADNPEYVSALYYRGLAHAKKKNKPQAIADFRQALSVYPDYQEAKAELKKLGVQK